MSVAGRWSSETGQQALEVKMWLRLAATRDLNAHGHSSSNYNTSLQTEDIIKAVTNKLYSLGIWQTYQSVNGQLSGHT